MGFAADAAEAPETGTACSRTRWDNPAEAVYTSAMDLCIGSTYTVSNKWLVLSVKH